MHCTPTFTITFLGNLYVLKLGQTLIPVCQAIGTTDRVSKLWTGRHRVDCMKHRGITAVFRSPTMLILCREKWFSCCM
jgi:hypothetical protein